MAVLVVGTEKNFAALRRRLFDRRVSNIVAGRVADAIREANPHVDLDALEPGTILSVPDVPEVRLQEDELSFDESATVAIDRARGAVTQLLEDLIATARGRDAEDAAERKRVARALERPEVVKACRDDDALARDLELAVRGLDDETSEAKRRAAALDRAHQHWLADLDALHAASPWGRPG
jgi:hypothetical protein